MPVVLVLRSDFARHRHDCLQIFPAGVEFARFSFAAARSAGSWLVWVASWHWSPRKTVAIWRLKWKLIETMSAKDILLEVAEKLPPEATLNDAIYELEFRQSVQQGLDELDRGEGIPIEQVKAKIAAWAGK
jgi:hypothetical protein